QSDGAPQGVAPPYPIPEFEHIGGVDTERAHRAGVSGYGHEMLSDGIRRCTTVEQPLLGGLGVGHRFLGGKSLGRNEEQRGFGVDTLERLGDVRTVYVGDEVD